MSKNSTSADAARTLAAVNAVLDGDVPHWTDPEFLAWERGQVGDLEGGYRTIADDQVRTYGADVGPLHDRASDGGSLGVHLRPMIGLAEDHGSGCLCDMEIALASSTAMGVQLNDYPPPEQTTYGPLLLGPEPAQRPDATAAVDAVSALDEFTLMPPPAPSQILQDVRHWFEGLCDCGPRQAVRVERTPGRPDVVECRTCGIRVNEEHPITDRWEAIR